MRPSLFLVLATLALGIILSACSDGDSTPSPELTTTPTIDSTATAEAPAAATPTSTPTPDIEATIQARLQATLQAMRTPTAMPTATATPTKALTPTPTRTRVRTIPTATPTVTAVLAPTATPTITPTPTRVAAKDPSSFPPFPNTYKGDALIGGSPVPDGTPIFARIDEYQTPSSTVTGGRYKNLVLGPPSAAYYGREVVFYATIGGLEVRAQETAIFRQANLITREFLLNTLDLHF